MPRHFNFRLLNFQHFCVILVERPVPITTAQPVQLRPQSERRSLTYHPRFRVELFPRQNIIANAGIDLLIHPDRLVEYSPRQFAHCDPSSHPFPKIPAAVLHDCCGFLRRVWNLSGRCASWLLYLDLNTGRLECHLPPQMCAPLDVRLNPTFAGYQAPPSNLRLAGSITSCPHTDTDELAGRVLAFDGVHVFVAPQLWMPLTAFVVAGGVSHLVPPAYVVLEDLNAEDLVLAQRLYLIDRLS
jgi:hypothetical protein